MASVKVNRGPLEDFINEMINENQPYLTQLAREVAIDYFEDTKDEMLQRFDENAANQEIEQGENSDGGILPFGNLFSFIGFPVGSDPVEKFRAYLDDEIQMQDKPSFYNNKKGISRYYFKVNIPDRDEIVENTEVDTGDWTPNDSWVYALEEGISNLSQYLFRQGETLQGSRSEPAIQVKGQVHPGADFPGTPYLTEILEPMIDKLDKTVN